MVSVMTLIWFPRDAQGREGDQHLQGGPQQSPVPLTSPPKGHGKTMQCS